MKATIEAPPKVGLRNSVTSNIGASWTNCETMNTTIRIAEAANSETISVLPQPSALPRMIASTNRNSDEVKVTVPIQSIRLPCGSRDSSTLAIVSNTAAAPMGTLMKKIEDQPKASVRTPPSSGPTAAAEAIVAPQIPNAVPRSRPWNSWAIRASPQEYMIAPPMPWPARARIRNSALGESAHRSEARANRPRPIENTSLRPSRSAREPVVSRSEARVSA